MAAAAVLVSGAFLFESQLVAEAGCDTCIQTCVKAPTSSWQSPFRSASTHLLFPDEELSPGHQNLAPLCRSEQSGRGGKFESRSARHVAPNTRQKRLIISTQSSKIACTKLLWRLCCKSQIHHARLRCNPLEPPNTKVGTIARIKTG